MNKAALLEAIEVLGSQSALARVCGPLVKQGHVYYWLNSSKKGIPSEYCENVAVATRLKGREVPKCRLRPDVFEPIVQEAAA